MAAAFWEGEVGLGFLGWDAGLIFSDAFGQVPSGYLLLWRVSSSCRANVASCDGRVLMRRHLYLSSQATLGGT